MLKQATPVGLERELSMYCQLA